MHVLRVTCWWCYGACLRQVFSILLRHWHMLEAHLMCMVEAYTWYMILFVWHFVEVHGVWNDWDISWVIWYMVEEHGLRSILDIGHILWDTFLVYVWGIPWWHWCMVRYIVDAWYGVCTWYGTGFGWCMIWYRFGTWYGIGFGTWLIHDLVHDMVHVWFMVETHILWWYVGDLGTCLVEACIGDVGHLVERFHWYTIYVRGYS